MPANTASAPCAAMYAPTPRSPMVSPPETMLTAGAATWVDDVAGAAPPLDGGRLLATAAGRVVGAAALEPGEAPPPPPGSTAAARAIAATMVSATAAITIATTPSDVRVGGAPEPVAVPASWGGRAARPAVPGRRRFMGSSGHRLPRRFPAFTSCACPSRSATRGAHLVALAPPVATDATLRPCRSVACSVVRSPCRCSWRSLSGSVRWRRWASSKRSARRRRAAPSPARRRLRGRVSLRATCGAGSTPPCRRSRRAVRPPGRRRCPPRAPPPAGPFDDLYRHLAPIPWSGLHAVVTPIGEQPSTST